MLLVARWTSIVGREETMFAVAIVQFPQIRGARQYVVVCIERISTEAVANTQTGPCFRHDLHQAHGAFW